MTTVAVGLLPVTTVAVGLLSGTSVDAIDTAAGELHFGADGVLALRPLGHRQHPWPPGLRERILAVLPPATTSAAEICALDNDIGRAFAAAATVAVRELAGGTADLVATLGQTVYHDIRDGRCHGTLQLGQPAWIAEATGLPVVSDLRSADVAAGGHGAPLASTLDALWLAAGPATVPPPGRVSREPASAEPASAEQVPTRAALNLGGIANVTLVTGRGALAFDTGPANCLLDLAAARATGGAQRCDLDGALASAGTVRTDLLAVLAAHPYFAAAAPKSCGRELFCAAYLDEALASLPPSLGPVGAPDLLATLTELTGLTVANAIAPHRPAEVVASGGGTSNPALMDALRRHLPTPSWRTSDELGLPAQAKEAYLVAILGALTWHGLPGTIATPTGGTATGARHTTILGRISPAMPPRTPPAVALPTRLSVVHQR